jgi:hypothetical protein
LFYQSVSRNLIENTFREYKKLGVLVKNARRAGRLDWEFIEDRTRNLHSLSTWDNAAEILESAADSFRVDLWATQDTRPEIWVEKAALVGVIEVVAKRFRVPYFACIGFNSESEIWRAGHCRVQQANAAGQGFSVLHLADHDAGGLDMTRDNAERLKLFSENGDFEVHRVALNMDQIERYKLPPNTAKTTDSRAEAYIAKHGASSWELDALDPAVIDELITNEIEMLIDPEKWQAALEREAHERARLHRVAKRWKGGAR